ncbi:3-oxoacyl-[acyl-carrier-protein] synthase-3 [Alpinimonas psychrophila]|uniref:3-oxoacyl-[acyl-carrier-protein] synthase-3 n=1 Tax=Alpinimonas psychrophila TaxID=748908 RepID=A0A7W3PNW0_9MICO|nr:3-oxoacyl-[acyl-carrier-protein] synthase-3 [Alpinimonas psychrophila]
MDTVIYITSTGDRAAPGNGHLLHGELMLAPHTLVFDINDACTGFVRSVILGNSLIASGTSKAILIVISDTYSKLYEDSNLRVSPLFSDGASAIILTADALTIPGIRHPSRKWEILSSTVISEGNHADDLTVTRGNEHFPFGELEMNGAGVFNFVVKHVKSAVAGAVTRAGLGHDEIDSWYIHQGSRAVVDAVSKSLSLDQDAQFVSREYGNVVGSAIPFQILAETAGMTETELFGSEGRYLFLLAFGVGLTLAGLTIRQSRG